MFRWLKKRLIPPCHECVNYENYPYSLICPGTIGDDWCTCPKALRYFAKIDGEKYGRVSTKLVRGRLCCKFGRKRKAKKND